MQEDLTIWVPTKNRPEFLLRLLKYYYYTNFKGYIFIGDSSEGLSKEINEQNIKEYSNKLNLYHDFYPNTSTGHVSSKLVEQIETNFCTFLADDDFIVTSAIDDCINKLNNNEDISGVNGKSILFKVENNTAFGNILFTQEYFLANLLDIDPVKRLNKIFSKLVNCNMCILRTKNQKKIFKKVELLDKYHSTYIFEELIGVIITSMRGKIFQLPKLFLCRQAHDKQSFSKFDLFDWISDKNWNYSFKLLEDTAVNELIKGSNMSLNQAKKEFKKVFWPYLTYVIKNELNKNNLNKYKINNIINRITYKIKNINNNFSLQSLNKRNSIHNEEFSDISKVIQENKNNDEK